MYAYLKLLYIRTNYETTISTFTNDACHVVRFGS